MNTYIALLRGINVGGKNTLPMKELVTMLEDLGLANVRTYIQSGNVVFRSRRADAVKLARDIRSAVGENHGFTPQVLVLTQQELCDAIAHNPFPEGESDPRILHFCFLQSTPQKPDLDGLAAIRTGSERFCLVDAVLYLLTPDGIARSRLAGNVEKAMGVASTARNWRTVVKLRSLADDLR